MTADELLDQRVELPEGAVPVHAILVVEYLEPGADDASLARLDLFTDDTLPLWRGLGMLTYARRMMNENGD